MAVQDALDFFAAARLQPELRAELAAALTPQELADLAARSGYDCTAADLQDAFRQDWIMRWLRHGGR